MNISQLYCWSLGSNTNSPGPTTTFACCSAGWKTKPATKGGIHECCPLPGRAVRNPRRALGQPLTCPGALGMLGFQQVPPGHGTLSLLEEHRREPANSSVQCRSTRGEGRAPPGRLASLHGALGVTQCMINYVISAWSVMWPVHGSFVIIAWSATWSVHDSHVISAW